MEIEKKKPRKKVSSDVYIRIVEVKGVDFVDNLYRQALAASRGLTDVEKRKEFDDIWPNIILHRVSANPRTPVRPANEVMIFLNNHYPII